LPPTATITSVEESLVEWPFYWDIGLGAIGLAEVATILPPVSQEGPQFVTYDPFSEGVSLTKISLLFAISYAIGMLVRYYPRHWLSFLKREEGDGAYPAMRKALRAIETDYPQRVYDSAVGMIDESTTRTIRANGVASLG